MGNKLGFEIVKICSIEPFDDYRKTLKERISMNLFPDEEIPKHIIIDKVDEYFDPLNNFPEAKSIISMAFRYHFDHLTDLTKPGEPHGVLARAYHKNVYEEMFQSKIKFANFLQNKSIKVVEQTILPHKQVAVRAGIGWQGKNSLIISNMFGSWFTLTSLIIDKEFECDEKISRKCGSCQACINACPTSAIKAPGVIDVNKCIDYITNKSGSIPVDLRSKIGNKILSCDLCQEVCPHNKDLTTIKKEIPIINANYQYSPNLLSILSMSNEDFEKNYYHCHLIDPCKESIQRNAIVALGNIGDPVAISYLKKIKENKNPLLKEHAEWSLNKIKK